MTKRYYIASAIATPFLAMLVMTSRLPLLFAAVVGAITMVSLIMAGFYLGNRERLRK
jgi:hypothetical protein